MTITLKEQAYIQLKQLILQGKFKPGDFLTERALVEDLGMSRTPIRSALERLDVEGLVNYTPNKGLIVAEVSIERAADFFDFRIALESYMVRKLANRSFTPQDITWFEKNLAEQRSCMETNDIHQFTVYDAEFHKQIALVYDNKEIILAMTKLQDKLFQIAVKVLKKDNARIKTSYQDHLRIFNLIREGNPDEAEKEMFQHLEFGKRILIT